MKVAICFNGYISEWKNNYEGWKTFFDLLEKKYNCEIDLFCHMWNFEENESSLISNDDLDELLQIMRPKSHIIDDIGLLNNIKLNIKNRGDKLSFVNGQIYDNLPLDDFYSLMITTNLKKLYEIKRGYQYDICFRIKYDFFFDNDEIFNFINNEFDKKINIKYNTLYSSNIEYLKIDNSFWFSDSVTFNKISEIYRWVSTLGKRAFNFKEIIGVDEFIFFFVKMLKMRISPITFKPKIINKKDG